MSGDTQRIVELGFSDGGQGSGFLATERHVFTACHLSEEARRVGARCRIRRLPQESGIPVPTETGEVSWVDPVLDIAVIRLDAPTRLTGPPLVCVELVQTRPVDFFFTGFPQASGRDTRTVSGILTPVPTAARLDLDYQSASPDDIAQWGGVSGAMVFHDDMAVGIVRTVSQVWTKNFTAAPLARLLNDPAFKSYWSGQRQPAIGIVRAAPGGRIVERDMSRLLAWCDRTHEYRTLQRLTATSGGQHAGLRLFGLAGHHDHRAFDILPRLVDELCEFKRNVKHIPLLRHPDFDSIEELNTGVAENSFESDDQAAGGTVSAMALDARSERWDACIVSAAFDCARLGSKRTRHRLDVANQWLAALADFPCPVVVALILRWGDHDKPGWLARLLRTQQDPVEHLQQSWSELEQRHGVRATSLCMLDGYEREDLRGWIHLKNVKPNLHDCASKIEAGIDGWFDKRAKMTFAELHAILSKF